MKSFFNPFFLLFFVIGFPVSPMAGDFRTWTSQDGRQIEARMTGKTDSQFTIVMQNGESFTLPITAVSEDDQNYIHQWELPFTEGTPEETTLIIRAGDAAGSGFLCLIDGAVYIVTNQHVIAGADPDKLSFQTAAGRTFEKGPLEISTTQDLARFPVSETTGLTLSEGVRFSGEVTAYGNSMGTGVITRERGSIKGMGSGMVEITAQIVPGNSGGPVISDDGDVVGVSTLVISGTENWVTEGSRYTEARRYATILRHGMTWESISWEDFYRHTKSFAEEEENLEQAIVLASMILQSPIDHISASSSDFNSSLARILHQHEDDIRYIDNLRARGLTSANQIHSLNRSFLSRHQSKMEDISTFLNINALTRRNWDRNLNYPYWQELIKRHMSQREQVQTRLNEEAARNRTFFYLR